MAEATEPEFATISPQLAVTTEPSSSVTAGASSTVKVSVDSDSGAVMADSSVSGSGSGSVPVPVPVPAATGTAGATASCGGPVDAVSGVATLICLATLTCLTCSINEAGSGYSLSASAAGFVSAPTSSIDVTATVAGAPRGLTATPGNGQVFLPRTAPRSDGGSAATGYDIDEGTSSGRESSTPVNPVADTQISYTATGLTNGTASRLLLHGEGGQRLG